ncbi:hypothetical protein LIER_30066 [Lithospermum erythrorhizon]|uniref:Uncharacterized protein n=1 Tax=Lithospermum erythrorhizon TaxID=34254 RepID=A0AAV3RLR8_LITER
MDGDDVVDMYPRDITVQTVGASLNNVPDMAAYYDPLQYVLLLPYGSYGCDVSTHGNSGGVITRRGNDSYPIYRRRPGPPVPLNSTNKKFVDNGWVIPYNPW